MSSALITLLQHAERGRDQALLAWKRSQAQLRAQQMQTQQLQSYRDETDARDPSRNGLRTAIDTLMRHRSFVQRLQQAQQLQQQQLAQAELREQAAQVDLLDAERRVAQVKKLGERRAKTVHQQQQRSEQRQGDEAAQQRLQHQRREQAETEAQNNTDMH